SPPGLVSRETRRDGGAGRDGETLRWRSRGDETAARAGRVAARGRGVAARHILDSDGDRNPFFICSLRHLLADSSSTDLNWRR
ncbi:unnamed protein product, partial [Urochloa humidicola]